VAARIVVVHPDAEHGSAIASACCALGFKASRFTDPIDAISYIERSPPRALVTAVWFGEGKLHGIALTLMARLRNPSLTTLLIAEPLHQAEAQRIAECVPAPGQPAVIAETLSRLIGIDSAPA